MCNQATISIVHIINLTNIRGGFDLVVNLSDVGLYRLFEIYAFLDNYMGISWDQKLQTNFHS